jgi:S-adenosylmethionine:tRNA ribosyltransferase-isomerase
VRTDLLDYDLPPQLIAQEPADPRDSARLLVYDRGRRSITHHHFRDVVSFLRPDDIVVVNTTRVEPVRLRGTKPSGGRVQALLLEARGESEYEALLRPARRLAPGMRIAIADQVGLRIGAVLGQGRFRVALEPGGDTQTLLRRHGEVPLPPYIHAPLRDPDRYQTVYAQNPGSAAAPTAGLHFTPALLDRLRAAAALVEVELRIGLDTFRPVTGPELDAHQMHSEAYHVTAATRDLLRSAHAASHRVIAIGTTTVRVLETLADETAPNQGRTSLLIQPGHVFGLTDAIVTNFHLPRSTLLALVMAFAGVAETRRIYAEAITQRYRFYSFGDAMLLL